MWASGGSEDVKLCLAALESYQTGRITPLLKEELKYHIQTRRLSQGMNELVVEPDSNPSEKQELRPDEIERIDRRREQNRRASEKFRHKSKSELGKLQKVYEDLKKRNIELNNEVSNLQEERDRLYGIVTDLLAPSTSSQYTPPPTI